MGPRMRGSSYFDDLGTGRTCRYRNEGGKSRMPRAAPELLLLLAVKPSPLVSMVLVLLVSPLLLLLLLMQMVRLLMLLLLLVPILSIMFRDKS